MTMGDDQGERLGCVQSLVRAFGILDELARHPNGRTLAEITSITGLPRSTTHRLLTTMHALRYVEYDRPGNRWRVGAQALSLGDAVGERDDLARLGRPIMRSLMLDVGETVNIGVADPQGVRCVAQVRPADGRRAMTAPGQQSPMHTTAMGKVILAHWPDEARNRFLATHELPPRTALSVAGPNTLALQLSTVRERGYAVDDQENELGMRCMAAPVFGRGGQVCASLSISGSVTRLANARLPALARTLDKAARCMSDTLGDRLSA